MGEKIVIGPINKGLRNDRTAFVIDNDSFPTLLNAYQWRGRVKRKRGTDLLTRLARFFNSSSTSYNSGSTTITLDANGNGNIFSGFSLQSTGSIVPGTVTLIGSIGTITYTDPTVNGYLTPTGTSGPNTIDYASGTILIPAQAGGLVSATFSYYPGLPVMGLEDFVMASNAFPGTLAFDTTYSYNIPLASPNQAYDISFYKNLPTGTYAGYVQKSNITPTSWNGQDYQQFWTTNYLGAFWATNGINVPFNFTNLGMQFAPKNTITFVSQTGTTITLTITNCPLVIGDFVFANEFTASTAANAVTLNFQTGYVTACTPNTTPYATKTLTITFPNATLATDTYTPGIIQYLTNRSSTTQDCLRWYDGDPTTATASGLGWVNFAPPLSNFAYSIADEPQLVYYLVGARMIVPFKDRLLFIGPVIQTSTAGSQVYLQDTIIYSQDGTPYYSASFTGNPNLTTTIFNSILVPQYETGTPNAYWEDQTGYGGFASVGVDQPIISAGFNKDVIILGINTIQVQLVYTGNDIVPFQFYIINSEFGTASTFSAITMNDGVISRGNKGFIITGQTECSRIDLPIPDEVFQISLLNNGNERLAAQRDFINEWIYFTYNVNTENNTTYRFPNQTLQYNYRDDSWAIFLENYTTYGTFRKQTGFTWATVGSIFPTWSQWNEPWNAGSSTLLQPNVIAGNQQGFVLIRNKGTAEAESLYITNISSTAIITNITQATSAVITANNSYIVGQKLTINGVIGMTQLNGNTYTIISVTPTTITIGVDSTSFSPYIFPGGITSPIEPIYSPNHGLNNGDFIVLSGILGSLSALNNVIVQVANPTQNGFSVFTVSTAGTYFGGGLIKRMYIPFIQTKQFPTAWGTAQKTRLGPQQYLLTTTASAQTQLLIYLSQAGATAFNTGAILPLPDSNNDSLIYSTVLYTCPESGNLGLTAANTNLQMIVNAPDTSTASSPQQQIWHRVNTSLIGDTVQVAITLSSTQMQDTTFNNQFSEIELHGIILDVNKSGWLA
jgi:hypothetical protein